MRLKRHLYTSSYSRVLHCWMTCPHGTYRPTCPESKTPCPFPNYQTVPHNLKICAADHQTHTHTSRVHTTTQRAHAHADKNSHILTHPGTLSGVLPTNRYVADCFTCRYEYLIWGSKYARTQRTPAPTPTPTPPI